MLTRLISSLKEWLGITKKPLGQANLSEAEFDTLPTPWPITQVEEEEDPRAV